MQLAVRHPNAAWTAFPSLVVRERNLELRLAAGPGDVRAAQRLRFDVFNVEMRLGLSTSFASGLDVDPYDDHCDHLLVLDRDLGGKVVGTYRLLPWDRTPSYGYYSESEFHLDAVRHSGMKLLELGRSCVAPEYRSGRVINLLLRGIAEYAAECGADALMGCASIHGDGVAHARRVSEFLLEEFPAPPGLRVLPRRGFDLPAPPAAGAGLLGGDALFRTLPPLFKGYLRLGARVCGPPAYDRQFGTVDFFVLLDSRKLGDRYRRRFCR